MKNKSATFFVDRQGRSPSSDVEDDVAGGLSPSTENPVNLAPSGAVWIDEDDAGPGDEPTAGGTKRRPSSIDIGGVVQRRKLRKAPTEKSVSSVEYQARVRAYYAQEGRRVAAGTWAELPSEKRRKKKKSGDEFDSSDDEDGGGEYVSKLMRSTGVVVSGRASMRQGAKRLEEGIVDIRKVVHANKADPSNAVVQAVKFHPSGRLVMTAGLDRMLRIFQVDGKYNAKVQGIQLQDLPISSAHFTRGGEEVVLAGRRAFFYQFDMETGQVTKVETLRRSRDAPKSLEKCEASPDGSRLAFIAGGGRVLLVSNKSKQVSGALRMDVPCGAATFSSANENHVYTSGKGGAVYLWDVRNNRCIDRHIDEGTLATTSMASSKHHYAIGSSTGVVNIYKNAAMCGSRDNSISRSGDRRETPERAVMNLATGISDLTFNGDGQLLAMCSRAEKGAVRLVHIPTMSVCRNWPTTKANLRRVSCLAFSPSGGFLAAGNDKGDALLFRVRNGYPAY